MNLSPSTANRDANTSCTSNLQDRTVEQTAVERGTYLVVCSVGSQSAECFCMPSTKEQWNCETVAVRFAVEVFSGRWRNFTLTIRKLETNAAGTDMKNDGLKLNNKNVDKMCIECERRNRGRRVKCRMVNSRNH